MLVSRWWYSKNINYSIYYFYTRNKHQRISTIVKNERIFFETTNYLSFGSKNSILRHKNSDKNQGLDWTVLVH